VILGREKWMRYGCFPLENFEKYSQADTLVQI